MSFQKNDKPIAGDIVRVHRKEHYYHYGIVVDENTVIHFTAFTNDIISNKKEMKILETSLERFLLGGQLEVQLPFDSKYSREKVVERAKRWVDCVQFRGKYYNLTTNNCEHFARYCYYGAHHSKQVVQAAAATAVLGAVAVGVAAGAVIKKAVKKVKI